MKRSSPESFRWSGTVAVLPAKTSTASRKSSPRSSSFRARLVGSQLTFVVFYVPPIKSELKRNGAWAKMSSNNGERAERVLSLRDGPKRNILRPIGLSNGIDCGLMTCQPVSSASSFIGRRGLRVPRRASSIACPKTEFVILVTHGRC